MARFPTAAALAVAPTSDVLREWAGLGYHRRAIDLQRTAVIIDRDHAGDPPRDVAALEALPGIGPYTARAVAAIAWGVPAAAVDTNVRRVVGRLVAGRGVDDDPGGVPRPRELQAWADALVDPREPGTWTHAVMDIGAQCCRARAPRCEACPIAGWCAFRLGLGGDAADAGRVPRRAREATPFPATRRWLRGRIMARLREAPDGAWVVLDAPIGSHDEAAVRAAAAALASEGLAEASPDGALRLPSTVR